MSTGKSVNKIVSFLLALVFVFTNTAYSSDKTLRVPLAASTQQRIIKTMDMSSGANTQKLLAETMISSPLVRAISARRTSVIGGNWKMEVETRNEATTLFTNVIKEIKNRGIKGGVEVVVGVPIAFLGHLSGILENLEADGTIPRGIVRIAAQNIAGIEKGAQTGRTSAGQVKSSGATHVIIGHSEQRRDQYEALISAENNAINDKVKLALQEGLVPIVCVGENLDERNKGSTESIVGNMIREAFKGLTAGHVSGLIIAYEPVWAIGKGKTAATPQQAEDVLRFIRKLVLDEFGEDTASKVRIIYGGSVKSDNIAGLMDKFVIPNNDGALVGGASLEAGSFTDIINRVPVQIGTQLIMPESWSIRTQLTVPEGQKPGFFTSDYHGYMISELFANPVEQIPEAVVRAVKRKLKKDVAAGRILSAEVNDYGASQIDIQVTHRFGKLNAAVQRLMIEAMKEGVLKAQELGLLKEDINIASMNLEDLAKKLRVQREQYSITERGSEPIVRVKLVGASLGAANIKLFHEFFVPGSTPLKPLGFLPVVSTKNKDKLPVRGFRAIVRKIDDVLKGRLDGDVSEFERSSAAEIDGVSYPSVDQSDELLAKAGQPNEYLITEIYPVEGSLLPSTEPLVKVVYQPVYGETGELRALNPTFLCRSQSGADAVAAVASMFYDVNFVPGGNNGERYVATMPVTKKEARRAPPEGIAYVVVDGWQFKGNGIIPSETDGVVDHVAINPPALQPERRLAKWLASIMITHPDDQPYMAPFAAAARVKPIRKAQSHLFKRAPKEADRDPVMDEVEAKVESGEFTSFNDDKADMGGKDGHNFTPEYMLAIDRATQNEAIEREEITDGNIIGFVGRGRLKNGTTYSIGDDGHILSVGDKSRNAANSHQSSFIALTRGYLASMVGNRKDFDPSVPLNSKEAEEKAEKPYGRAQDYMGKEAKAAKANPYFYSHFSERFFEILRETMPLDYKQMVDNMYRGWKYWEVHGTTGVLPEPFSGNVSSQGMGTARYLVDSANGERTVGVLAGDKCGPAGINRPIREGVYALDKALQDGTAGIPDWIKDEAVQLEALQNGTASISIEDWIKKHKPGEMEDFEKGLVTVKDLIERNKKEQEYLLKLLVELKKGMVFEIWDAKAFDELGNIPVDELPQDYADIADAVDELKDKTDQNFVKGSYRNGLLRDDLAVTDKEKLAGLIKKAGFVPTKRIYLDAQQDKEAIYSYLADSDRFNIKQVWSKKESGWDINNPQDYLDKPVLGSSVTKLGILAGGEYIGKDDPVMVGNIILMEHIYAFMKKNPVLLQGDMNGSHWLAAIPTAFKYAVANKESHPILIGMVYTLSKDGKAFASVKDVFGKKEYHPIRRTMFEFNRLFKIAQLGGQFEPYGTNRETIESAYPKNKLLKLLDDLKSPFLIRNQSPQKRKTRPVTNVDLIAGLFKAATADELGDVAIAGFKKGSPKHGWEDIVKAKLDKGATFTKAKFAEEIRSKKPNGERWSDSTIDLELQGLVAIGVLGRDGDIYTVLVEATLDQINQINEAVKPLVSRRGMVEGGWGATGIDAHRLDADWLRGKGDLSRGYDILDGARGEIAKITGTEVAPVSREAITRDPVKAIIDAGALVPATVFINEEERPFTIAGEALESYETGFVAAQAELAEKGEVLDTRALLANLVGSMRLVSSDAKVTKGEVGDFDQTKVETVLFKDTYVTGDPKEFAAQFADLGENKIAVIISTSNDPAEPAIQAALKTAGLSEKLGDRIVVMGVKPGSSAAYAFGRLFDANGPMVVDLNTAKKILENKDAVIAIGGAV